MKRGAVIDANIKNHVFAKTIERHFGFEKRFHFLISRTLYGDNNTFFEKDKRGFNVVTLRTYDYHYYVYRRNGTE